MTYSDNNPINIKGARIGITFSKSTSINRSMSHVIIPTEEQLRQAASQPPPFVHPPGTSLAASIPSSTSGTCVYPTICAAVCAHIGSSAKGSSSECVCERR